MVYRIGEIARDVRIAIDENVISEPLIAEGDIDTLSLDEIIRSKILEGVKRVVSVAPVHMLEEGHLLDSAVYWGDQGSGWTLLPDDFLRLLVFKMSDWERPVYNPITVADPQYALQHSRYKGVRGNPQKPVVAYVVRPEGKVLEFYSCKDESAYLQLGMYVPMPIIDDQDGIDLSKRCYEAVVYMAASLVLMTVGEGEKSKALSELATSLLQ